MWRDERDRPDDPRAAERETQRLARDEYERPRYGSPAPGGAWVERSAHEPHPGEPYGQWTHAPPWGQHPPEPRAPDAEHVRVHQLMTRQVATVHPASSVERAARLMEQYDCGALPVVGDNRVLIGIISDRDIAMRVVARGREARHALVGECMTERVFACHVHASVADCMRQMAQHQVRRMPIVDEAGRVVGIVAQGDLARHAGHHAMPEERHALAEVVCAVSEPRGMPRRST